jgi:hypothetical protein
MTIIGKLFSPSSRPPKPSKKREPQVYNAVAEIMGTLGSYQDIPRRFHKQWITGFLAIVILWSIIAGLYLSVTTQKTIAGRQIQEMQHDIGVIQKINADLQTDIALQLSSERLAKRAKDAGYVPLDVSAVDYIIVPGYVPQQGISLSAPVAPVEDNELPDEYYESLFTWIDRQLEAASLPLAQDQ